jgi:hypothetical protein
MTAAADLEPWAASFDSPRHAYLTGDVLGTLRAAGIDAVPVIDTEGNYTSAIALRTVTGSLATVHVEPPDA